MVKLKAATGAVVGTHMVGSAPYHSAFDGTSIRVANTDSNNLTKR